MIPAVSTRSVPGAHRSLRDSDDPADARFWPLVDSVIAADLATTLLGSRSFEAREELSVPVVFYQWFIVDGRTGRRKLMPDFMTCAQAAGLYPGAQPDLRTCGVRAVSRSGESRDNIRPAAQKWRRSQ